MAVGYIYKCLCIYTFTYIIYTFINFRSQLLVTRFLPQASPPPVAFAARWMSRLHRPSAPLGRYLGRPGGFTLGGNHAESATVKISEWYSIGKTMENGGWMVFLHHAKKMLWICTNVQILLRSDLNHISVKSGGLRWDLLFCFMFMMWAATASTKPVAQQENHRKIIGKPLGTPGYLQNACITVPKS